MLDPFDELVSAPLRVSSTLPSSASPLTSNLDHAASSTKFMSQSQPLLLPADPLEAFWVDPQGDPLGATPGEQTYQSPLNHPSSQQGPQPWSLPSQPAATPHHTWSAMDDLLCMDDGLLPVADGSSSTRRADAPAPSIAQAAVTHMHPSSRLPGGCQTADLLGLDEPAPSSTAAPPASKPAATATATSSAWRFSWRRKAEAAPATATPGQSAPPPNATSAAAAGGGSNTSSSTTSFARLSSGRAAQSCSSLAGSNSTAGDPAHPAALTRHSHHRSAGSDPAHLPHARASAEPGTRSASGQAPAGGPCQEGLGDGPAGRDGEGPERGEGPPAGPKELFIYAVPLSRERLVFIPIVGWTEEPKPPPAGLAGTVSSGLDRIGNNVSNWWAGLGNKDPESLQHKIYRHGQAVIENMSAEERLMRNIPRSATKLVIRHPVSIMPTEVQEHLHKMTSAFMVKATGKAAAAGLLLPVAVGIEIIAVPGAAWYTLYQLYKSSSLAKGGARLNKYLNDTGNVRVCYAGDERLDKYQERMTFSPDGLLTQDDIEDLCHELGQPGLLHPLSELRARYAKRIQQKTGDYALLPAADAENEHGVH